MRIGVVTLSKKKKLLLALSIAFVSIILFGVALGFTTNFWYMAFWEPKAPEFLEYPNYQRVLSPGEMQEDLMQLKADLAAVHPSAVAGLPAELETAFADALTQVSGELTVGDFSIIASSLACLLEDAHTAVSLSHGDRPLPAEIKIIQDRFYILGGVNLVPGDELLSLGGVSTEEILVLAKKVIPAENPYWRQHRIASLLSQSALTQIGADIDEKRNIDVEIRRDREIITVQLNFGYTYSPEPSSVIEYYPLDSKEYGYYLDLENRTCVFKLSLCVYDEGYNQFLRTMFQDIKGNGIENIIVDLRGNLGGNSMVADEFLKYVDIEEYKYYGATRRMSKAAAEQRGHFIKRGSFTIKPWVKKNRKVEELLFDGVIYALADNGTFSSANFFAVVLADNDIGTIIGEPTGNAPNCFGDILGFQLENSKLIYSISYTQWVRPDAALADADALYPDYPVTYSIEDYINKRDLAMEEALRLIQEGK